MKVFELEANEELRGPLGRLTVSFDAIVWLAEEPDSQWKVQFSTGGWIRLSKEEFDDILAAWRVA